VPRSREAGRPVRATALSVLDADATGEGGLQWAGHRHSSAIPLIAGTGAVSEPAAPNNRLESAPRHPQPFLEMFWRFEIPKQMREEYGYPELT
jgi:hypothetical protein